MMDREVNHLRAEIERLTAERDHYERLYRSYAFGEPYQMPQRRPIMDLHAPANPVELAADPEKGIT